MKKGFLAIHPIPACCLAMFLALGVSSSAQQGPPTPPSQAEINQQFLLRIEELEKEVQRLTSQPAPSLSPAAAPEPTPVVDTPPVHAVNDRLTLNVFGDVGFHATDDPEVSSNTFDIGNLDIFMTSRLSEKVSLLGEVLFIANSDNTISADVERLLLRYRYNDYFAFAMGRYHTSIGYYNTAFHRGAWFETTIGRPFMYAFDDEIPLQEIGVTASGRIPSGKLRLHYVAEVGNGRVHTLNSEPAQNTLDQNNGKSFDVALFARPAAVPDLQVGFSIYHDYITFPDNINHSELISTAYAVYVNSKYELLNEAMLVRHTTTRAGAPGIFHTSAFYTQLSRAFGKYRPYFRYEYFNSSDNDPIYGNPDDGEVLGRRNGPSVGLRYDFNEHAAFKLQYDRLAIAGEDSSNTLGIQFAFTF
jgi:hypothetical protein